MIGKMVVRVSALGFGCGELTFSKDERTGRIVPASKPEEVEKTYTELKSNRVRFSEEMKLLGENTRS